jgi:hypothetical protein
MRKLYIRFTENDPFFDEIPYLLDAAEELSRSFQNYISEEQMIAFI